jgi:hypothetical protein
MFRYTFESFFKTKEELREEISNLLWKIDHTWLMGLYPKQIDWIKEKIDGSFVKLNGGAIRYSCEVVKNIHQHSKDCQFCKAINNKNL